MEWNEQRLQAYIDSKEPESLYLDYKGSDSLEQLKGQNNKKPELIKDISSFANTDGGILIYGIREGRGDIKIPEGFDDGIDPGKVSREQLDQIIRSNLHPKLDGIRIFEVPLSGARAGKVAYVIEVPRSFTAHQGFDNRYHKRCETTTAVMEAYEVRDAMNRAITAQLEVRFDLKREPTRGIPIEVYAYLKNTGTKVINNTSLVISPNFDSMFAHVGANFRRCRNNSGQLSRALDNTSVIFPSQEIPFIGGDSPNVLGFSDDPKFSIQEISWTLYADDMPPKRDIFKIADFKI
jgi:hypothetical protein